MTVYGPDLSNHNTSVDFAGLDALPDVHLVTHKLSEGIGYTDPLAAGRSQSISRFPAAGFYHVLWPTNSQDNPQNQAAYFVGEIARLAAWMFTHPCPILQGDFELFSNFVPYRAPSIAECNAFMDECLRLWRQRTSNPVVLIDYAPYWLYGNTITGLPRLYWASSYVGGSGGYRQLYPGDHDARWAQVPSKPADVLQYSSSASFGSAAVGVDANAVRNADTAAELQAYLLGGDVPLSDADLDAVEARALKAVRTVFRISQDMKIIQSGQANNDKAFQILDSEIDSTLAAAKSAVDNTNRILDAVAALPQSLAPVLASLEEVKAAVAALPGGETDMQPVLDAIAKVETDVAEVQRTLATLTLKTA